MQQQRSPPEINWNKTKLLKKTTQKKVGRTAAGDARSAARAAKDNAVTFSQRTSHFI